MLVEIIHVFDPKEGLRLPNVREKAVHHARAKERVVRRCRGFPCCSPDGHTLKEEQSRKAAKVVGACDDVEAGEGKWKETPCDKQRSLGLGNMPLSNIRKGLSRETFVSSSMHETDAQR